MLGSPYLLLSTLERMRKQLVRGTSLEQWLDEKMHSLAKLREFVLLLIKKKKTLNVYC